ncbi:MAG: hypothetical protein WCD79_17590 [Chthoniobacteraceae bacterium]
MKAFRSYFTVSMIFLAVLLWFPGLGFTQVSPKLIIPPAPSSPGIFGIGFTNITGSSARLVFTTSEPMSTIVKLSKDGLANPQIDDPEFSEIHSVNLPNLVKGGKYYVSILGATRGGLSVSSKDSVLVSLPRPPSRHQWPGRTIIGTSVSDYDDASLDLLAQTGVHMVRIEAPWSDLFPKGRELDKTVFDELARRLSELKKRKIEPLLVLDYCVPWAKPYTNTTMTWRHPAFGPPDSLDDWEFYLRTVITSFDGYVKYYEIWNEPDAGYLSTGNYVERPDFPTPIGKPPFKDNWNYWLGDRFVPMIERARAVLDEIQPDALLMNGGWNRDYTGQRGDLLLERGVGSFLDLYAFHCYSRQPLSFSSWYSAIDGGFRANIDRIFEKHKVNMPIAVTEWGWPSWEKADPVKGFVSFEDAQKFYVKSAFYFLGLQRVEILMQFDLSIRPDTRDRDPWFYSLVTRSADGTITPQPPYKTLHWLIKTFDNRSYRILPLKVTPSENVKAFAIQLKDSGTTYLAAWRDGKPDEKGHIATESSREVEIVVGDLDGKKYFLEQLDMSGIVNSESRISADQSLKLKALLPEISSTSESGIYLVKITADYATGN